MPPRQSRKTTLPKAKSAIQNGTKKSICNFLMVGFCALIACCGLKRAMTPLGTNTKFA